MWQKTGLYEKHIKRIFDVAISLAVIILFGWLYILLAVLVRIKLGSPVIFAQKRPGQIDCKTGQEKIFTLYKFRTMTDESDVAGNLLPDEARLTPFGKKLRSMSLDELPEIWNVLKGDMSLIGPRPQLVRDMVFMSQEYRRRHSVRPGLSGLAQVHGRNAIDWEKKLDYDLRYVDRITFCEDMKIIWETVCKVLLQEGITEEGSMTATDYGYYLLRAGKIDLATYEEKQEEARKLLEQADM
ncbi:MAG: sugar transferase [Lachnospiraceae bacterium]|jgi:lipopolysaccharide/colanic/teichoic acid biosynthesis glycosyltransferase|nr:sugar transferase [Lachnospiraceae bacterium]